MNKCFIIFFVLAGSSYTIAIAQHQTVRTFYDEHQSLLKETITVIDGQKQIRDGKYISFYENGNKKSEGFYKNDEPTGFWNYYYESGKLKMRGGLRGNTNYGLWRFYFENGNVSMEGEIYNGQREGKWNFYFENGLLKSSGEFKNGERCGIWNHYYEDKSIKAQAYYKGEHGLYREFYADGKIRMEGFNLNGKSDSLWTYYYENGIKQAEGRYKEGHRNGEWTYFHENGNISANGTYDMGIKSGKWTYFHENGKVSSEGEEREGKKEGYWKIYDRQGHFKGEGIFREGTGEYKEYYENGNIKVEGEMDNGINIGHWKYYYPDGNLEGECLFVEGEGDFKGYYPGGSIKMQGAINNGKNVGEWKLYKEDGTLEGYYRPIYEEDKPVFKLSEKKLLEEEGPYDYMKPDYRYKKRHNRYFTPVINEYKGFILATNPAAPVVGSIPFSLEYYFHERLGHEIQLNLIRDPFFKNDHSIEPNTLYARGFDMAVRQKFYHPENGLGMFYFANELRYTMKNHYFNTIDTASYSNEMSKVQAVENKIEYSFILGNRWMRLFGERWQGINQRGLTVDLFLGVGIGYRSFEKKYDDNASYDEVFNDLHQNNFSISPRIGVNIGMVF
ncbi:MAG: toxin-antitoxin system YwqK family antitoxin [Cyclobacteriaceae bacterium]|nr:toxin-antitoxin system YwqK family antitoxin [Cyclobacteriaceae bacterium]